MKITTFNPVILTKNADAVVELFEELGFKRRHQGRAVNSEGKDVSGIRMKDENGFYVDVSQNDSVEQDKVLIRVNVDDFEEAYNMLIAKGFKDPTGTVDTRTNNNAGLVSPSGFTIHLCHHIKDHD
ncbi:MAG: hypothetical protein J6D54_05285 [Olsenella sp.]|nr:hypothetical protein [Olsenella sp.]